MLPFKPLPKRPLLIIEIKHCLQRISIISYLQKQPVLVDAVEKLNLDPELGLNHALEELRQRRKIPKQCLLLTTQSLPAIIPKIDESNTQKKSEMIRWQIESELDNHFQAPSLTTLLRSPNFLPEERIQKLELLSSNGTSFVHIDDLIKEEVINNSDLISLNEYIDSWPQFQDPAGCYWSERFNNSEQILSAYISQQDKQSWIDFFTRKKLDLKYILPWHCNSYPLLAKKISPSINHVHLESSLGLIFVSFFEKGILQETSQYRWNGKEIPRALLDDLDFNNCQAYSLQGFADQEGNFDRAIGTTYQKILLHTSNSVEWPALATATTAWTRALTITAPMLSMRKPPLPLQKKPAVYWMICLLISLPLTAHNLYQQKIETSTLKKKDLDLDKKIKILVNENQITPTEQKEFVKLKSELAALGDTQNKELRERSSWGNFNNSTFVNSLKTIATKIGEGLSVDSIQFDAQNELIIKGKTLSQTELHKYIAQLSESEADFKFNKGVIVQKYDKKNSNYSFQLHIRFRK